MKGHESAVHDIGDKTCEACYSNVWSLVSHTESKGEELQICRKCLNERVGAFTRVEKSMADYVSSKLGEYVVLKDRIIAGSECNTRRRPDMLLSSSPASSIVVECDENQHQSYNPACELARMCEIFDEIKGHVTFIRWNPHTYDCNGRRANRATRLERLVEVIQEEAKSSELREEGYTMTVIYMYYSADNPAICDRDDIIVKFVS